MASFGSMCLVLVCAVCLDAVLIRRQLTDQDYPGALCNNGQPAVFYHTLGQPTTRNFIMYLQGGYFCTSIEDCEERCKNQPYYCSPTSDPTLIDQGILSEDLEVNPVFGRYYKAFVQYCTSDFYIGDSGPTEKNGGFHFRGRAHILAVVNSLKSLVRLGKGDRLIVSGTSAGGRGVVFNCEYIASLLPDVDVRCIVDAAVFYPNWERNPFTEDCKPFKQIIVEANEYYGGVVESFDVHTWWKTFTLPLFIGFEVFDFYGYRYFCINETDKGHLQKWADGMKAVSESLLAEAPHVGLYLPGCYGHVMLRFDHWFQNVKAGKS